MTWATFLAAMALLLAGYTASSVLLAILGTALFIRQSN